jgi:hypothetical protein
MNTHPTCKSLLQAFAVAILLTLTLGLLPRTEAQNLNYNWCFSPAYDAWRGFPEPVIDGTISPPEDIGWSNSFRYVFNNGTTDPDVVVLARAQNGHLDLGVTVKNDPDLSIDDTIVIAFGWYDSSRPGPANSPNTFARIHVSPVTTGGVPASGTWTYWSGTGSNSTVTWSASPQNQVAWLNEHTTSGGVIPALTWSTEIRIQLGASALPVPTGQPLSFYFNLFRAQADGFVTQFPWPSNKTTRLAGTDPDLLLLNIISNTPAPSFWGRGIIGATTNCNGINFSRTDITSNPAYIVANTDVALTALLHNNSIDGATGATKAATQVTAAFSKAPFGMSGFNNWSPIGQVLLPSIAYDGPALGGAPGTPATVNWHTTTADLQGSTEGHNCIRVQLTSSEEATTFINQGEFNNMWVHSASRFEATPVLDTKGLSIKSRKKTQRIHITTDSRFKYAYADGYLKEISSGTLTSELNMRFIGQAETSLHCNVGNKRYNLLEPLISYGYIIQHAQVLDFQKAFEEKHAERLNALYQEYRANVIKINKALPMERKITTNKETLPMAMEEPMAARSMQMKAPAEMDIISKLEISLPAKRPSIEILNKMPVATRINHIRLLNTFLATLPDTPQTSDWQLTMPKVLKRTAKGKPNQYIVEVPTEGEVLLPSVIEALEKTR